MNILLAIKPDYADAILAGTKTVELRNYLPAKLHPGDTIYLVGSGRVWGHCTFAGATPAPPPGDCRARWLESLAVAAARPAKYARYTYIGSPYIYAWHIRYPVSYGPQGRKYDGASVKRFVYVTGDPSPAETHPRLENYLLYLRTHKTP